VSDEYVDRMERRRVGLDALRPTLLLAVLAGLTFVFLF